MAGDDSITPTGDSYPPHQPNCLGCGDDNRLGLHLRMRPTKQGIVGDVSFRIEHEGAIGFAHGGAVATALDDALGILLMKLRRPAVTARLEVDYRRPAFINRRYTLQAQCDRIEGRKLWLEARLLEDDQVVAEARGLFLEVDVNHFLQGQTADDTPAQEKDWRRLPW